MKCQDEKVSTVVCMCNYISLHEDKTQHAPRLWSLEHGPVVDCGAAHQSLYCSEATCWIHNITNPQKSIVTTFCGRSQQRDCVNEQPCTCRPLLHLCDHASGHVSVSHWAPLQLPSVSVSDTSRIAPSTRPTYSLRPTNSPHQVPQFVQDSSVTFALQLLAAHSRLVHPLCHRSRSFSLRSNPLPPPQKKNLRGSLRIYTLQT